MCREIALLGLGALAAAGLPAATACSAGEPVAASGNDADKADADSSERDGESAAPSQLTGTWDVIAAYPGGESTAVLELWPERFSFVSSGSQVLAELGKLPIAISGSVDGVKANVRTTHRKEALDLGVLPFDLGGAWSFQSEARGGCTGEAAADYFELDCTNVGGTLGKQLMNYDLVDHKMLGSGRSSAQQVSKRESIFGALGGTWSVTFPRGGCEVEFESSKVHVDCTQNVNVQHRAQAKFTFTFDGETMTGVDEAGDYELAATRRPLGE